MKNLDEKQVEQLANLTAEVKMATSEMSVANDAANKAIAALNDKIDAYNEVLTKVNEFVEEITGAMEEYADDKGTKWSESEAGSHYEDWKADWQSLDLDQIDQIEDVNVAAELADQLEQMATEPNK